MRTAVADSDRRVPIHALLNPMNQELQQQTPKTKSQHRLNCAQTGLSHDQTNFNHGLGRNLSEETILDLPMSTNPDYWLQHHRRDESVPSASSRGTVQRRACGPSYTKEEMCFVWYYRVDLGKTWKEVQRCFNRQFYHRGCPGRSIPSLQAKFYRFIKKKKCPTVLEQRRLRDGELLEGCRSRNDGLPAYGVVNWCGVWFPWMRPEHAPDAQRAAPMENQQNATFERYGSSQTSEEF